MPANDPKTPEFAGELATHAVASSLALGAFTVAIIAGLAAGSEPIGVLWRAIISMVACYLVGVGLGAMGIRAVKEHVEAHAASNPIPDVPEVAIADEAGTA
ncbi:MAG: hypothetical protein AAF235_12150 [Planctomycetota bacterium]